MLANMNTQAAAGDVAEGAQQRFLHDIVHLGEGSRAAAELEVDQHGQPPLVFFEGAGEGVPVARPGLFEKRESGSGGFHGRPRPPYDIARDSPPAGFSCENY
jgi:hypothetical protein